MKVRYYVIIDEPIIAPYATAATYAGARRQAKRAKTKDGLTARIYATADIETITRAGKPWRVPKAGVKEIK